MTVESRPVFVVGPVRSGSTFLRLMLDSHPGIANPGECDFLFDMVSDSGGFPLVTEYLDWLSSNRIYQAKQLVASADLAYGELMQSFVAQMRPAGKVLAMNVHRHFHRIPKVFPNARYIRLLRDPRDVARSCIGMGWVGHVYYGVDIWIDAEDSWQKLKSSIAPESYLEIRYEDLVADVRTGLSAICRFLELEYSDEMMQYSSRSTYAAPDRSLSYQWKKKYSPRELQLVEGKLGDRLAALGYESGGHGTGRPGFFERIGLYLSHRRYRAEYQIKRYGIGLYIEHALAGRVGSKAWRQSTQQRKNRIDIRHLK